MSNGEKYTATIKDKQYEKVAFDIEVNGTKYVWGVGIASTKTSLFGQLALLGKSTTTLEGQTITLIVKGTGMETDYTILEAQMLVPEEERIEDDGSWLWAIGYWLLATGRTAHHPA